MTHRTIPEIRGEIHRVAKGLRDMTMGRAGAAALLDKLAEETRRRPPVRRAPVKAKRITKELRAQIVVYAHENPAASCQDIGVAFGINSGRVSEILAGKRGAA